jgi:rsbT co-antagonist protein RsbR
MQLIDIPLPLPYVVIESNGRIISSNSRALNLFDLRTKQIDDIIDQESINKLITNTWQQDEQQAIEVVLKTRSNPLALFDVYISWDHEDHLHILFAAKDKTTQIYTDQIMQLQSRLANTDFELYEQKEKLEQTIYRLNSLSGPFIPLTATMGYIPLFGDLTEEMIHVISANVLQSIFIGEYDDVLVDLTSIADIKEEGINKFMDLIKMIHLMNGNKVQIVGANPRLAKILYNENFSLYCIFKPSLQYVLKNYYQ